MLKRRRKSQLSPPFVFSRPLLSSHHHVTTKRAKKKKKKKKTTTTTTTKHLCTYSKNNAKNKIAHTHIYGREVRKNSTVVRWSSLFLSNLIL